MVDDRRLRWEQRYRDGVTPWDTGITPPEVVAFWRGRRIPPGARAIDLGCGTGTNVAFLAGLGLDTIGIELSGTALMAAHQRKSRTSVAVAQRMAFAVADVAHPPLRHANATYILDIGCFHGVPPAERDAYVRGVDSNLATGGHYHLFGFDRVPELVKNNVERGFNPDEVVDRFGASFSVAKIIRAKPDRYPCRWYLLRKK